MRPFSFREIFTPTTTPWEVIFRAAFIYLVLIAMLRLAGRKELSRYSVFDVALLFLVTVAARESIVASDTSLTTAVVALGTLVLLDAVMGRTTPTVSSRPWPGAGSSWCAREG